MALLGIGVLLVSNFVSYERGKNFHGKTLPVKALIISMFAPEAKPILSTFGPWQAYNVSGLNPQFPQIMCNQQQICSVVTGMGYANAATTITRLVHSGQFDFTNTYFFIAGIGGINPHAGTLGTPAWANYVVDFGIQQELDARDKPANWDSGYIGVDAGNPTAAGPSNYQTQLYRLNKHLTAKAYELSKKVSLQDNPIAGTYRKKYPFPPANQPPRVTVCDTVSSDTWFSGTNLANRAEQWTRILTKGAGRYCTTQQEDNATLTALQRGAEQGLVDFQRVLDLRVGSDFDRPYPGGSNVDNLVNYAKQNGFSIATANIALTLQPVLANLVTEWQSTWEAGIKS